MCFIKQTGIFFTVLFLLSCSPDDKELSRINIWHQMHYENRKVFREVCDEYEKQHLGIKINLTYRETEELRTNFQSAAMGGSGPELIYGPSDQVGPFATMGIIQPLESLFEESFFDQFVDKGVNKAVLPFSYYFQNLIKALMVFNIIITKD